MKKLLLILTLSISSSVFGQSARTILEQASEKMKKAVTSSAKFNITQFEGTKEVETTIGNIIIKGRKLTLTTKKMQIWFDGHTQWSMYEGCNEVNIQQPDDEQQVRINPYAFLNIYKKGYGLKIKNVKLRNIDTYEITMTAKNKKQDLNTITVNLSKKDLNLMCIRMKYHENWMRISVYDLKFGKTLDDSIFTFPQNKFPNVTLIDLR